jgi:hypothetical protein
MFFLLKSLSLIASTLTFDIGQLFADDAFLHLKYIDSADMSLFSCRIHPDVSPAHDTPNTKAENLLDLNVSMGRLAEEVLPKLSYDFLPQIYSAVGSWLGVFEDTIIAHKLHHPCDIMTIESLIELKNDANP